MATKTNVFDKILADAFRKGISSRETQTAAKWFRNRAKALGAKTTANSISKDKDRSKSRILPGRMYHFFYDPKHKKTLPYYDRFPLIFPIGKAKGGFLGMNFHYIPQTFRAKLMDALFEVTNNKRFNKTTKLIISYQILNSASKYKYFRPCVKHYLKKHVRSKFSLIESVEWNIALFLPTEKFMKEQKTTVWKDSRRIIRRS